MLTRKHLEALATALASTGTDNNLSETETVKLSGVLIDALVQSGGVTPHFDPERFETAVISAYQGA